MLYLLLFPRLKIEGSLPLIVGLFVSAIWSAYSVRRLSRISFKIANCNTTIEVFFGDIFEQDGISVIPVGAYFETQLGKPVSNISLHGIFIEKFFSDFPRELDAQIDEQLKSEEFVSLKKAEGKGRCYRIGTTALVTVKGSYYILFALSNADAVTLKASSDVELMWRALHKLWQRARNESNGHAINLPLVGSGLSNLGLTSRDLLNLLILSAITETKELDTDLNNGEKKAKASYKRFSCICGMPVKTKTHILKPLHPISFNSKMSPI